MTRAGDHCVSLLVCSHGSPLFLWSESKPSVICFILDVAACDFDSFMMLPDARARECTLTTSAGAALPHNRWSASHPRSYWLPHIKDATDLKDIGGSRGPNSSASHFTSRYLCVIRGHQGHFLHSGHEDRKAVCSSLVKVMHRQYNALSQTLI